MNEALSPVHKGQGYFPFIGAIEFVLKGGRIYRKVWEENAYAFMENDILMLNKSNGKHQWILSREDLTATDWEILDNTDKEDTDE